MRGWRDKLSVRATSGSRRLREITASTTRWTCGTSRSSGTPRVDPGRSTTRVVRGAMHPIGAAEFVWSTRSATTLSRGGATRSSPSIVPDPTTAANDSTETTTASITKSITDVDTTTARPFRQARTNRDSQLVTPSSLLRELSEPHACCSSDSNSSASDADTQSSREGERLLIPSNARIRVVSESAPRTDTH